ncbi:MAG TPA: hypothetical protein VMD30_05910, partial [Tepidisphaeraceae bacterium]|nr:hypothetical protein [Tepidisphaeraceae bacterium]
GPRLGLPLNGAIVLLVLGGIWTALWVRSIKGSRLASDSPSLIAMGRYDEAEHQIDAAIRTFSLFRAGKLVSLHHLAVLRHAQRRWQESAMLCKALLGQRLGALRAISRPSLLLLADDLLQLNDLPGAYLALRRLYAQKLGLVEALSLQGLQLDYLARMEQWEAMLSGLPSKVQLAELMPATPAARSQALLALAALKTARTQLAQWLRGRAQILVDPASLVAERPFLAPLWPQIQIPPSA